MFGPFSHPTSKEPELAAHSWGTAEMGRGAGLRATSVPGPPEGQELYPLSWFPQESHPAYLPH